MAVEYSERKRNVAPVNYQESKRLCRDREIQIKREYMDDMRRAISHMNEELNKYGPQNLDEDDVVVIIDELMDVANDIDEQQQEILDDGEYPESATAEITPASTVTTIESEQHLQSEKEHSSSLPVEQELEQFTNSAPVAAMGNQSQQEPRITRPPQIQSTEPNQVSMPEMAPRQELNAGQQRQQENPCGSSDACSSSNIREKSTQSIDPKAPVRSVGNLFEPHVHDASETDFQFSLNHPFVLNVSIPYLPLSLSLNTI